MIEANTPRAIYQPAAIVATKSEIEAPPVPAVGVIYSKVVRPDLGTASGSGLNIVSGSESRGVWLW
jgi:hypothetical protein